MARVMDPAVFLCSECYLSPTCAISRADLQKAYRDWCVLNKGEATGPRQLARAVRTFGGVDAVGANGVRLWSGCGLLSGPTALSPAHAQELAEKFVSLFLFPRKKDTIAARDVQRVFTRWCGLRGVPPCSARRLGAALRSAGARPTSVWCAATKKRIRGWAGLAWHTRTLRIAKFAK
jgi:hypothetical protein